MSILYKFRHIFILLLFVSVFFLAYSFAAYAKSSSNKIKCTIAIDAGHGGQDPGKVGINGALEKDVNLAIALKLSDLLEKKGFKVVLTRTTTNDLAEVNSTNRKLDDLKKRVEIINNNKVDFSVSIHQNSFTNANVCGPQTFYYEQSQDSKDLASLIQESLDSSLEITNPREIKANSDYYIFKKIPTPTVIVECGFLSNPDEAQKLTTDEYQNKIVKAIYNGIINYYNSTKKDQK